MQITGWPWTVKSRVMDVLIAVLVGLYLLLVGVSVASAQTNPIAIVPGPLPTLSANCTIQRNAGNTDWVCASTAAASQPLTDAAGLIANNVDPTKVLFFQLSGLTTNTNRTWTIPDANITVPSTIASLAENTFTGLQTANGGIAATTGTFSSTLGVTGATTLASLAATTGTFSSTLGVTGATTLTSLAATTGTFSSTLGVTGATTLTSLAATTGTFSSTLGVTGATTLTSLAATTGTFSSTLGPSSNDAAALGSGSVSWSDLFLASGGVVNFNDGDVTVTHSSNVLAFAGASTAYTFADGPVRPATNDGAALGVSGTAWSDLFLASGGVINFNAGDVTITHSSNVLTFAGASSGYVFNDGTLAWGGGSSISSSGNVALLNAANTFTLEQTVAISADANTALLSLRNANTGTAAASRFRIGTNLSINTFTIDVYGSSHATLPNQVYILNQANAALVLGSNGAAWQTLSAAGALRLNAYGAGTLVTDASGNVTASSDERLKDITGDFTPGLSSVLGLRPILHTWKPDTGYDTENVYASWRAQNVQQYIPEAVGIDPRGNLTVNDRPVVLALVNAVKELTAEVDTLRAALKLPVKERVAVVANTDTRKPVTSDTAARRTEQANAAEDAKRSDAEKAEQAIRTRLTACEANNAIIVKQGGKPLVCGGQ